MAEHLTRNEKVVGSIPTISSNKEVTTKVVTSLLGSAHFIRSTLRRFQCSGAAKPPLRNSFCGAKRICGA